MTTTRVIDLRLMALVVVAHHFPCQVRMAHPIGEPSVAAAARALHLHHPVQCPYPLAVDLLC